MLLEPDPSALQAANQRWRRAVSGRTPKERERLERISVLAVAIGDRLGLDIGELLELRVGLAEDNVEGEPAQTIARVAHTYEAYAYPESGESRTTKEALRMTAACLKSDAERQVFDALGLIAPLVQPIRTA